MAEGSGRRRPAPALLPRIATILVGAPILIATLWAGDGYLLAVILLLAAVGAFEFTRLAALAGYHPSIVLTAGAVVFPMLAGSNLWALFPTATAGLVVIAAAAALTADRRAGAPGSVAVDVLGALFVGALFAHLILLRAEAGFAPAVTVLGVIWANDIAAYLVGVRFGRRKLAPAISPRKSVEGFAGGLAMSVVVAAAAALWMQWPLWRTAFIGLSIALAGVVGDLSKSTIKRAAGVKDSGVILPGHGGVIDRFDAVLFGVPVGYYLWRWLT
jgi:phosphatidate cytidylyltransferase